MTDKLLSVLVLKAPMVPVLSAAIYALDMTATCVLVSTFMYSEEVAAISAVAIERIKLRLLVLVILVIGVAIENLSLPEKFQVVKRNRQIATELYKVLLLYLRKV